MDGIQKTFYASIGLVIGFCLTVVLSSSYALTKTEELLVIDELEHSKKYTGKYQPIYNQDFSVFTYESLCSGFYIQEDKGTYYKYTGFGDLANQYTFNQDKPIKVDSLSTSTESIIKDEPTIDIPPVIDPLPEPITSE